MGALAPPEMDKRLRHKDRLDSLDVLVADIATLKNDFPNALDNVRSWAARGFPARSPGFGDGTHSTGVGNPVLAQVMAGGDEFARDLDAADKRLSEAVNAVAWLARFVRRNQVVLPMEEPTDCISCGRYVARTAADPLRRGRCNACDVYFRRHGKDRGDASGLTNDATSGTITGSFATQAPGRDPQPGVVAPGIVGVPV
jgi:hypothetical protein